ncbi:MAG: hypothetical protein KJO69_08785, partial [Gammaproteobacteria bacterium]|nr:hypothetical protein [Gammaproteobacteria bacterium]
MNRYRILAPNGREIIIKSAQSPTQEQAAELISKSQSEGLIGLSNKPTFKKERTARNKRERLNAADHYPQYFEQALGAPKGSFDMKGSLKGTRRAAFSALQSPTSRRAYLHKEFGEDNVRAFNVDGSTEFVYKNPESKKWQMVDPFGFEWADFTSDMAGEFLPTVTGAVAGLAAGIGTAYT